MDKRSHGDSIVNIVLEHGATATAQNLQGKTALDYGLEQNREDIARIIQAPPWDTHRVLHLARH